MTLTGVNPAKTAAATNGTINFQAKLETTAGAIAADGNYNVEFNLYSALTGGSSLWHEDYLGTTSNAVHVVNGYLTVNLGAATAFPTTINWDQDLYLGMTVHGTGTSCAFAACTPTDAEMAPRLKLTSTPYAFAAGKLAQYNGTTTFTSTLTIQGATVGNQNFVIPDQGAGGTFNLLTTAAANTGYIQNQNSLQQASTNFWISGTGRADTGIVTPSIDVASAGTLNIGNTTATTINIGGGNSGATATTVSIGSANSSSTISLTAKTFAGNDFYIGTGSVPSGLTGRLTILSGSAGQIGEVIRLAATPTADALQIQSSTGACLYRVNAAGVAGTCDSTTAATNNTSLKSGDTSAASSATGTVIIQSGSSTTSGATGQVSLLSGNATSGAAGNVIIDTGTFTSGTPVVGIGTTNAAGVSIGKSGAGTTVNGTLTSTQLLTGSAGVTVSGGAVSLTGSAASSLTTTSGTLSLQGAGAVGISTTAIAGGSSAITIQTGNASAGTAGTVTIDNGTSSTGSGAIAIGTSTSNHTITIGNAASGIQSVTIGAATNTTSTTAIQGGNGASAISLATGNNGTAAGGIVIGNTTGAFTQAISIGANTTSGSSTGVTIGSTVAGSTTLQSAGGVSVSGALSANGGLTVSNGGNFAVQKTSSDFSTTGSTTDAAFGNGGYVRLTGATAQTINGIAGGANGRILTIVNAGSTVATIKNGSGGAGNQVTTGTGADLSLPVDGSVTLIYDSGSSKWRVSGQAAGVGVTSVGAISGTSNAAGATISGTVLTLTPADITNGGVVTNTTQTFLGAKTFATSITSTGLITGNAGISTSGGAVSLQGNAASSITTTAGALGLDAFAAVNVGTSTATSVSIGKAGANTLVNGTLTSTQLFTASAGVTSTGGAVSLTGNAASSLTTTSGGLTIQGAGAVGITTTNTTASAGITVQTGNSSSGTAGTVLIDTGTSSTGTSNVSIGTANAGSITIGKSGTTATINGPLTANGPQFTNNGSTLLTATTLGDQTGTNPIGIGGGTAAATVDVFTTFRIGQTTSGQTLALPTPTSGTAGRLIYVINTGSTPFTMHGISIVNGKAQTFIYDGANWTATNIDGAGSGVTFVGTIDTGNSGVKVADGAFISGNGIYLQSADATSGGHVGLVNTTTQSFAGNKTFAGSITGSAGITTTGGAVSLTGNAASSLTTTSTNALTLTSGAAATWGTSAGNLTLDSAATLNLGTSAATSVSIGKSGANTLVNGSLTSTQLFTGSAGATISGGAISLTGNAASSLTTTTGTLTLQGAGAVGISTTNAATSAAITIQTGNSTSGTAATVTIDTGTSSTGTSNIAIGTTNAGSITIGKTGSTTTIGGPLTASGLLTASAGVTVATGFTLTNSGSTLNTAMALTNIASNGNLTTAANLTTHTTFDLTQTTGSITLTLPAPTDNAAGRVIYVINDPTSTQSFTIGSSVIGVGVTASFVYNGSAWVATSTGNGVTTIGAIAGASNANGATITGNTLNLTPADITNGGVVTNTTQSFLGAKTFATSLTSTGLITGNAGITTSGGVVSLQGNAASSLTTTAGGLTIDTTTAAGQTIAIGNSAITHTIQIGTSSSAAQTIAIGGSNSGTTAAIQGGAYTLNVANSGIAVNGTPDGTADFQFGVGARSINIQQATGSGTAGSNLTIKAGAGSATGSSTGGDLILQAGAGSSAPGSVRVLPPTDSTTAFYVTNAAGGTNRVFDVDTSVAQRVIIGSSSGFGASLFIQGNVATTGANYKLQISGNLTQSGTGAQQAIQNQTAFQPAGATLTLLTGLTNIPAITGGSTAIATAAGAYSRIDLNSGAATFTGTITNGAAFLADTPTVDTSSATPNPITNYSGFLVNAISTNPGVSGKNASNSGVNITVPTSNSTFTTNYGLQIQGNGGATSTNYGIYDSSTAPNYIQGNVSIGANSGSNALNVTGAGSFTTHVYSPDFDAASAVALTLGTNNASSIAIGKSSITTTITGGLTQQTGAVSLTANNNSSLTTTTGTLTLQGAGAVGISTTNTGTSSAITIQTGNSSGGTAGSLTLDTGTSSAGTSNILIGAGNAGSITIGKTGTTTTIGGPLTASGLLTANAGVTVATGFTLTNSGSTLNTAMALTNIASNGNLTTAANLTTHTTFDLTQTTGSIVLALPAPTDNAAGRVIYVINDPTSTQSFTIGSSTIGVGVTASFVYNGSAWVATSTGNGVTTIGAITGTNANGATITGNTLNLTAADGTNGGVLSNTTQNIVGAKTFTTNITSTGLITGNAGITTSGGAFSIQGNAASTLTTANGTTSATIGIQSGNASAGTAGTVTIDTGTSSTGTSVVSIGTANAGSVSIGKSGATTTVNGALTATQLLTGSAGATIGGGAIALTGNAASSLTTTSGNALTLTSGAAATWGTSAGNLTLDSAATLNLGTSAATSVSIGKTTTTTTINGSTVLGASTGTGTLTNNGATVNTAATTVSSTTNLTLTASSTVDAYTYIPITSSTGTGVVFTIPAPSSPGTYGRTIYVTNVGTNTFTFSGTTPDAYLTSSLKAGATASLIWANVNGTGNWTYAGSDAGGIFNQTSQQTGANFNIDGSGTAGTSFLTPKVDTASAATLSLGTTTANAIAVGKSGVTTTITGGLTQLTGAVSLTGNAASNLSTTAGALTLQGAGGVGISTTNTTVSSGITVQSGNSSAGTAGTVLIDTGTSSTGVGAINIGTVNAGTITIGNATAATAVVINAGSTGTVNINSATSVNSTLKVNNGGLQLIGTNTSTNQTLWITQTLSTSSTGFVFGIQNQNTFSLTGASLSGLYAQDNSPVVAAGSANITNLVSTFSELQSVAGYTGTISAANDFIAGGSGNLLGTKPAGAFYGFHANAIGNGNGLTTGFVNNYGVQVDAPTASAASGGTVVNNSGSFQVGTGSGAGTTTNYGIVISGNGGSGGSGTTTNYSLYNSSTAFSYFAGNVGIGVNSGSNALNVNGTASASTSVLTPKVDVVSGALNLGTTTATSVLIGSSTSTANTIQAFNGTAIQSTNDSSSAFAVLNSVGASMLSVDTTQTAGASAANLAVNGGAETGTTTPTSWAQVGSPTSFTRTTTAGTFISGTAAVQVTTTTTAGQGVMNQLGAALSNTGSQQYTVSFSIKAGATGTLITNSNLKVVYLRNGATADNSCSSYTAANDPTINTSTFIKYTCVLTPSTTAGTASAAIAIEGNDSVIHQLYVDNFSIVAQTSTANTQDTGVVRIGGASGQGLTLFQLDTYAGTPFTGANQSLAGAMYFDTTAGKMQCYDGNNWGACGAAPNSNITLTPEYTGAVLHGVNSAYGGSDKNIGTLNSDFCATSAALTVGSLCASGDARNFYSWTTVQPSYQSYGIYVTYKLPSTFKAFVGNTTLTGRVDNITNAGVNYSVFRSSGGTITQCGGSSTPTNVVGWDGTTGHATVNTWQAASINPATSCAFSANDYVIFRIDAVSQSSANAYVENLNFSYSNQ